MHRFLHPDGVPRATRHSQAGGGSVRGTWSGTALAGPGLRMVRHGQRVHQQLRRLRTQVPALLRCSPKVWPATPTPLPPPSHMLCCRRRMLPSLSPPDPCIPLRSLCTHIPPLHDPARILLQSLLNPVHRPQQKALATGTTASPATRRSCTTCSRAARTGCNGTMRSLCRTSTTLARRIAHATTSALPV